MSERKQKKMGYVNGETNGETNGEKTEYVIPRSIPNEPVSVQRQPWIPPKDSKLEHPGTTPIALSASAI
jgi:peroxygenase